DLHVHLDLGRLLRPADLPAHARELHGLGRAQGLRRRAVLVELRRDVRDVGGVAGAAVLRVPGGPALPGQGHRHDRHQVRRPMSRTRYGLVGAGSRAQMYVDAVAGPFVGHAELVAWADTNPGRLDVHEARLREAGRPAPARFAVDEVAAAVREHALDRVVVTSPDATHADHVVAVLEGGADAVVEKPLTTTVEGVRAIADAVERTGRSVVATFNYRYSPRSGALRELLASGRIGEVTSVHFEWLLDTSHGADYFRRWHRDKQRSGGLLVHKASHHFDLVGWWLDDVATRVYCSGGLRFYGARNAAARGLVPRPARGTQDPPLRDPFALDLRDDPVLRALYLEQEHHDGYLRDQDPFSDPVSIEDNLALVVDYARGATMSYSLNAHAPWE